MMIIKILIKIESVANYINEYLFYLFILFLFYLILAIQYFCIFPDKPSWKEWYI